MKRSSLFLILIATFVGSGCSGNPSGNSLGEFANEVPSNTKSADAQYLYAKASLCPDCSGIGKKTCDSCHGVDQTRSTCEHCHGIDQTALACEHCLGNDQTKITCEHCDGIDQRTQTCEHCNGVDQTSLTCQYCNGSDQSHLTCETCSGTGSLSGRRCYGCSGTGTQRLCVFCHGSGKRRTCVFCHGSGKRRTCVFCHGNGKRRTCVFCHGSGKRRVCVFCHGSGKQSTCVFCHGRANGDAACATCDGGGVIEVVEQRFSSGDGLLQSVSATAQPTTIPRAFVGKPLLTWDAGQRLVAQDGSYFGELSAETNRPKNVFVNGYLRKDGTYVASHYRSLPVGGVSSRGPPLRISNGPEPKTSYYGELNKYGVPKTVPVRGYFRKNGTYVQPHFRGAPRIRGGRR